MDAEAVATRPTTPAGRGLFARPWWPLAKRVLTAALVVGVLALVAHQARSVDWPAVWVAMKATPASALWLGAACAAGCYLMFCGYELVGQRLARHRLPPLKVAGVGFISYAFNMNLGSLVGGVALRFRLYSRLGLESGTITEVLLMSLVTNWLGYMALAGLAFTFAPLSLPADWELGRQGLRAVGIGLLTAAALYVGMAFRARRRVWQIRKTRLHLPSGQVASVPLLLSCINWSLNATIIWLMLQQQVGYPAVLSITLLAAVAGIITHVPGNLGVMEGVFVALLGHQVPQAELLGALLAYRALYYLAPLAIAALLWLAIDSRAGAAPSSEAPAAA